MDYSRWLLTVYGSLASGGGSAPFSPLSLSPHLWLDPSDLSTLFQDSAMTTPVTADGDPVGAILDKSGNGFHLTQATAGSRPTYQTSGGLHWLEFDGTNDLLSEDYTLSQPWERVSAIRFTSGSNIFGRPSGSDGGVLYISAGTLRINSGAEISVTAPDADADFVATERHNGASSRLAVDNNAYQTGNAGSLAAAGVRIAATTTGTGFSAIRFYGTVQVAELLADSAISDLRTYLAAKQGRVL